MHIKFRLMERAKGAHTIRFEMLPLKQVINGTWNAVSLICALETNSNTRYAYKLHSSHNDNQLRSLMQPWAMHCLSCTCICAMCLTNACVFAPSFSLPNHSLEKHDSSERERERENYNNFKAVFLFGSMQCEHSVRKVG